MYDDQDIKPSRSFDDIDREIRGQQRPPALKPSKPVKSFDDIDREVRSQSSPDVVQYPQNPKVGQTIPLRSGITMTYAGDPKDRPAQPPRGAMGWTGEDTDTQGKPTGRGMVYHKPVAAPGEFKSPINMDFRAPTEAQKMADRALQAPSAFQASRPKSTFERIQDQQALEMRQPQTVETDPIRLAQLQRETAEYQARKQRQQAEATTSRNQTLRKIGGALNPAIGLGNALNDAGVPDVNRVLQSGGKSVGSIVRGAAAASTMYPGAEWMYKFITGNSLRDTADRYGRQAERLTNQASEALLPEQEQDQSFRAKIERGAGSMLPPVGAALATGGGSAMAAGVGALANLGQVASERDQSGVPVSDTRRAMSDTMAVATGMTEALGIGRLLNRVGLKTPLIHRVAQMVEEGGQEYAQDYLNDINAKLVAAYDPQRQINNPLAAKRLESAAIGAILGGAGEVADVGAQRIQQQVQNRAAVRSVANERPNLPTDIRPTTLGPTQIATVPGARPAVSAQPTVDAQPHAAQNDFQKHFALRYQNGQFTLDEAIPLEQAPPQNVKALVGILQGFQTKPDVPPEMAGAARNLLQQVQSRLSQTAPASGVAEPSPAFPRLPEPEGFNARRAKLLGMDVPPEIAINERIAQADKLLGSQNESDQRLGKRILKQSLEEIQKSEGYQGELGQPDDAPKPYTAVRQAIESKLKPAPQVKESFANQVPTSSAIEAEKPSVPLSKREDARLKAVEFEQQAAQQVAKSLDSGRFRDAQDGLRRQKDALAQQRRLIDRSTPEGQTEYNRLGDQIQSVQRQQEAAKTQARQIAKQANAPTTGLAGSQRDKIPNNIVPAENNIVPAETAPLLRPEAVQNPEGGIPQMPEQTFSGRLNAGIARDQAAHAKAKPAKRLLSRIAELGGIDERHAGELQGVKDARRIGVIRQRAQMSPDILARQLQSEGYDVDPENLDTLWEAARRDIVGKDERAASTASLGQKLAEQEAEYYANQTPFAPPDEKEYVSQKAYDKSLRDTYFGEGRELPSTKNPQTAPVPPLGSWMIDDGFKALDGREIHQLVSIPVDNIEVSEDSGPQKWESTKQYAKWIQEGKEAPPIRLTQTEKGTLKTMDHRRLMAAKATGQKEIKAWVSWTTHSDREGNPPVGLTYELAQKGHQPIPIADAREDWKILPGDAKALERIKAELADESQLSPNFDQIVEEVDSDTGYLKRAIDRSNQAAPRPYNEETRYGQSEVSFSPYADLVARNAEAVDRLHEVGAASAEGRQILRDLQGFARKNGIEQRHVHALADSVRNYEMDKAFWQEHGLDLSTVQKSIESLDNDIENTRSLIAKLPDVSRTEAEREVAALDSLFEDADAVNLLERAAEGDHNARNEFQKRATEYGLSGETVSELIRVRTPDRGNVPRRVSEERPRQGNAGDLRQSQEPRSPTTEEFDLLSRNPATIPSSEFDAHLTAVEKLRNDEIRGIVKLSRDDKREMFRQLRNLNEERKFRVQRKELPAKFESRTLPVDKEFVRQSVEKATQPKARETKIDQMVIDEAESLRQEWGILKTFDKSNIQGAIDNARVQTSTDPSNKRAGIIYVNSNAKAVIDEIWSANGGAKFSAAVALDTPALEAVADVLRHEASFLEGRDAKQVTALADAFSEMVSHKYDGAGLINVDLANHGYLELARNHELFHVWQYGQSQPNNPSRKPMDVKWAEKVNGYEKVRATLTEKGYPDDAEDIVRELAAYSATNDLERLGFSKQEAETVATDFLYEYFTQISKQYGAEHLERIGRVSIPARAVAERVRNEVRSTQTASGVADESRVGQPTTPSPRSVAVSGIRLHGREEGGWRSGSEASDTASATPQTPRTREGVENSPEFKRWFGDSKAVDENGKPLMVYHGTASDVGEFSMRSLGSANVADLGRLGFFFSPDASEASDFSQVASPFNPENAKRDKTFKKATSRLSQIITDTQIRGPFAEYGEYTEPARQRIRGAIDAQQRLKSIQEAAKQQPSPNVMPVYLSLQKPAHLSVGDLFEMTDDGLTAIEPFDLVRRKLQKQGYDGAIIEALENEDEDLGLNGEFQTAQYVAFKPEQIKSAIGNRGTFNPSSAKIDAFKPELKRSRASFGELENEPRGQVAASGLGGLQNLFNRKPKAQSPAQPVPLPQNFNLANWTQKFYREAMAAGLNKADRAKYDTAKTLKEKNAVILSATIDPKREQSIFDIIDKADAATGKNDGSALYDALSEATDMMRHRPSERGFERVKKEAGNALNLPRALMASADISAPLRQGSLLTLPPSQWGKAAKATVRMFESFSTKQYARIGKEINLHPDAETARDAGLYISTDKSGLVTKKEEDFISNWADKIPLVKHSEQAYKTYLDSLRMDTFARYKASIDKTKGLSAEQKGKAYKAAADWINVATGRGTLGQTFENAMPTLSRFMFAPRYTASRIQVLNPLTYAKNARTVEGRVVLKNQMADMVQYAGVISATLAMAAAYGAQVGLDPDDADFLKIKVGNTRYDTLAGLQQPMRLFYRMGKSLYGRTTGEKTKGNQSTLDIASRFGRSKLAPVPSFFVDYLSGKDFTGQDFKLSKAVADRVTPLMWKDMADAYEKEGGAGAVKMLPAMFGIGVQNYAEKTGALKGSRFTKEAEGRGLKYDFIRQKVGEPEAVYKQRVQRVEGWMSEYGDKLLSHPRYGTLTAAQQEAAIESLRRRIGTQQNTTRPRLDSFAPEKVIQSVLKSEATRPKREAGKLWVSPK